MTLPKWNDVAEWAVHHSTYLWAAIAAALATYMLFRSMAALRNAMMLDQEEKTLTQHLLTPFNQAFKPATKTDERILRQRLQRAGLRTEQSVNRFLNIKVGLFLFSLLLGAAIITNTDSFLFGMLFAITTVGSSTALPEIWLDAEIANRQARIARSLPTLIDLMVLCLDVGLSIEASFEKVTSEMQKLEPVLSEEAGILLSELNAGLSFPKALKRFADRVGLEELTVMSRLITQAASLGASITTALREYSEASYTKRMLQLEEMAGKMSSKLLVPISLCFLPAVLLTMVGPAVVMLREAFGSK